MIFEYTEQEILKYIFYLFHISDINTRNYIWIRILLAKYISNINFNIILVMNIGSLFSYKDKFSKRTNAFCTKSTDNAPRYLLPHALLSSD